MNPITPNRSPRFKGRHIVALAALAVSALVALLVMGGVMHAFSAAHQQHTVVIKMRGAGSAILATPPPPVGFGGSRH
jgi:hypothetical protein